MTPNWRLGLARLLFGVLALRVVWAGLGAVIGIYGFIALGTLLPGMMTTLDTREVELGSGRSLPLLAVAWLAAAALGATGFTMTRSAMLRAVNRRLRAGQ